MVTWKKTLLGMAVLYLMGAAFIAFPTVDLATNDVPGAEGKTVNKLPPAIAPPPTVRTMPKAVGSPYNYRFMAFGGIIVLGSALALTLFVRSQTDQAN